MTFKKAQKIVRIWGIYLEYCHAKLSFFFGLCNIPESFLPFPKNVLEEALNMVAEQHPYSENKDVVNDLQRSIALLGWYTDDQKAMSKVAENFNDKKMRDILLSRLKKYQDEWIATQKL